MDTIKIIISLRNDVFERIMIDTTDSGFQQEKYESFICRLKWSHKEIEQLISSRISKLYKMKYTREKVGFYTEQPTKAARGMQHFSEASHPIYFPF